MDYSGKWVVFHDEKLAGYYETSEDALNDATARFGRGPYLIRRVGSQPAVYYLPTPALNDDCWDDNGNPDLAKWAQQPRPVMFYRPRIVYPEGYWDDGRC